MKERFVMTTFMMAGLADVATTMGNLNLGYKEIGIAAGPMVEMGNHTGAYVYRMTVTAVLIGLYAFSKEHPHRFSFSIDRGVRIANVISWGIVTLNTMQLAQTLR